MIKYSIIIPHRNLPELLRRCLNSIPHRSDVQIIVVDDNSDAETVDFDHFPGVGEKNVEVYFTKEGKGAGYARNVGLRHAKGEWILFADADDVFTDEINVILNRVINIQADIVYFDIESRDSETLELTSENEPFSRTLKSGNMNNLRYGLLTPWMKAIKRDFICSHNITFEEVPCSNDTRFSALCGYYAKEINIIPIVGYCWMKRSDSLWRRKNDSWYITRFNVSLRLAKFFKNRDTDAAKRFLSAAQNYLYSIESLSTYRYFIGRIKYGIVAGDYYIIYNWAPRFLLYKFKTTCGINIELSKFYRKDT